MSYDPVLTAAEQELMLLLERLTNGQVSRLELRRVTKAFVALLPRLFKGS
jgi:hypothetical protein